ncbi:MAG: HD domain-containing phosphohydrolase [Arenicellales bacterium]
MDLFEQVAASEFVSVVFDGIVVHDGQTLTAANIRAAEMFGYDSPAAMVGLAYEALLSPAGKDQTRRRVNSHYEGRYSAMCKRRSGEKFIADVNTKEVMIGERRARIVAFRYGIDRSAETVTEAMIQRSRMLEQAVASLATVIEHRDAFTSGHQGRVSTLGEQIARRLGMSEREIATIRMAGKIHDVGKVSIPAEILMKPSSLTGLEYSFIKRHAELGADIVKDVDFDGPVLEVILQHHERLDGSGYPNGIRDLIPEARVIAVADVFDAMTSPRPYRPGLAPGDTVIRMKEQETGRLDPEAMKELFATVPN